jgi:hypothetical protein
MTSRPSGSGLLQWLHRKQYQQMSHGVVPVRLVV